jgi:hypothetical protein
MFYICSTLTEGELGHIFGVLQTTVSRVLDTMIRRIINKLRNNPLSLVKLPNEQEMRRYADLVAAKEPSATNIMGFLDGFVIPVKCAMQDHARYYNSVSNRACVKNILLFSPQGTILNAAYNYRGKDFSFKLR